MAFVSSFAIASCFAVAAAEENQFQELIAPVIRTHCIKCHGKSDEIEGEIDLFKMTNEGIMQQPELIRKLIHVLDLEEMPPEDEPQITSAQRQKMVRELKVILKVAVANHQTFAQAPIRRMNRFQYNNAVIDLFDLRCVVFTLPERMMREHGNYFRPETGKMADLVTVGSRPLGKSQLIEPRLAGVAAFPQDLRAEHGFDNRGDHLSLSPLLMESFLELGQSITESPDFSPKNVGVWQKFFAAPANQADLKNEVRNRLKPFLTKAFRRPAKSELVSRYAAYVDRQLDSGVAFADAMKSVAAAAIASPRFLYLYDASTADAAAEPLGDFELASRLSFFLWGSIPDDQLLDRAAKGELQERQVLTAQIDRMLKDQKLKRFCDSFPTQWLQLERIISSAPNPKKYPQFYYSKYRDSMHMMLEPLLLFETVLIENQSITQLIDSDFTYRSSLLEESYGDLAIIDGRKGGSPVTALRFNRRKVTDRRNGGVITNAAVMTMTSGPDRTQPITRGAWVATVIFNDPPEPPPADVPPLGEKPSAGEEDLTLRERLAMHRKRADCKGCHEQIDPLGFALENYNAIGVWRERYENNREVDSAGSLFRKHEFQNVVEFKDAILAEKDRFARGLAGHLLAFALARELTAADQVALDEITSATVADDYKIQTLIKEVIFSEPFQSKSNPPPASDLSPTEKPNS